MPGKKEPPCKFYEDLIFLLSKKPRTCQVAAFSATYTPEVLTKIRAILPDANFLHA